MKTETIRLKKHKIKDVGVFTPDLGLGLTITGNGYKKDMIITDGKYKIFVSAGVTGHFQPRVK